ncbi:MAG: DNA-binding protein [Beggiatoa sp. IS2]|nr:MAG: DNA-binding protein [Beggiatoa sp. IS2]
MAVVAIHLADDRLKQLQETARTFGLEPEELLRISVEELLAQPERTFQGTVNYVLKKNAELYQRLA